MSERVEEIGLDREGIAHFLNEQHQGWHDGMGSLSQTRVYGTALLLADAVRAALAQAEREREEARAERNARARDVMHLEAALARVQEILTGACARYDHWYVNGASCEAGNMAYELVSAMRAALEGRS